MIALFILLALSLTARGEDYPNCRGFIDRTCCCTNNCCRTISMRDVEPVGNSYRVIATGQTVERLYWSNDGETILCDCNGRTGRAYCLYRPMPNS